MNKNQLLKYVVSFSLFAFSAQAAFAQDEGNARRIAGSQAQSMKQSFTAQQAANKSATRVLSAKPDLQANETSAHDKRYLKDVEKSINKPNAMEKEAFASLPGRIMPLNSDQIGLLHMLYNRSKYAEQTSGVVPPKPTSSSLVVDLSPGASSPVIRLGLGYVTSLTFLDATGAPWPIQAYDIGNPQAFNIQWIQSKKEDLKRGTDLGNNLLIQANSMYKSANLAVMLQGLNTPVMITLMPGQKAIDYRADIHIPRHGPLAKPMMNTLPNHVNNMLLDVLNNILPSQAKILTASRDDLRAWQYGETMYIRTALTLISPGWRSTISSSDGMMHAYEIEPTGIILVLDQGKLTKVTLKGL